MATEVWRAQCALLFWSDFHITQPVKLCLIYAPDFSKKIKFQTRKCIQCRSHAQHSFCRVLGNFWMWKPGFSQNSWLEHRCTRSSSIGTKVLLRPCEGYPKHWKSSLQTFHEKYQCFGSMRKTIHTPSSFGEHACLCCLRNFSWVSEKARQSLAFTEPHSKLRKQQRQAYSPKEEGVCIVFLILPKHWYFSLKVCKLLFQCFGYPSQGLNSTFCPNPGRPGAPMH